MKSSIYLHHLIKRIWVSAIILAMIAVVIRPSIEVQASSFILGVSPGLPMATQHGGTVTFNLSVTYQTTPSYILLYVDNKSEFCRFYDMNGLHDSTWNTATYRTRNCYNTFVLGKNAVYENISPQPAGTIDDPQTYSRSGIDWVNVPSSVSKGQHILYFDYYYTVGGVDTSESGGYIKFNISDYTSSITLRKFYDSNDNRVKDTTESWASSSTTPVFNLCLYSFTFDTTSCKLTSEADPANGDLTWENMATDIYDFWEDPIDGWGLTVPETVDGIHTATVTTAPFELNFGNAQSDMVCSSVVASDLDYENQKLTYTLNYEKQYDYPAKDAWVELYFVNKTVTPTLVWSLNSSTITPTSGDGSSGNPYRFDLSDIYTPGSGSIQVVINVSGHPTGGTFEAYQSVGSTFEPVSPDNNNCSKILTFVPTAVNAASFTAQPQGTGVQLGWWANIAGTDWLGFKLQSKLHSAEIYADVPNGFFAADPGTVGGKDYSFLDDSVQTGYIDYQLVPVTGSGDGNPVLQLSIYYGKSYIPMVSR